MSSISHCLPALAQRLALLALGWCLSAPAVRAEPGVFPITDFGAVADGATVNSPAINRAVQAAARAGGVVVVPAGRFVTGTIYLRSGVTLRLEAGAELIGSTNLADYPENPLPRPKHWAADELAQVRYDNLEYGRHSLIYAAEQSHVAVVGPGRIIGRGDHPNLNKRALRARGVPDREAYLRRPYGLCFVGCSDVAVRGITLETMAFWCQDYLDCDGVTVEGVTVRSQQNDANNDGIDLDGSRHVRVTGCTFLSGDDSICFKSSYADCDDIEVTDCRLSSFANGIKFGTASSGAFRNIRIANITMQGVGAAGLALEVVDGGTLDGVRISGITMEHVGAAIFVRLGDRASRWIERHGGDRPRIGQLRNVTISDVTASLKNEDDRPLSGSITGLPGHPVENITLANIRTVSLHHVDPAEARRASDLPVGEHAGEYPEYSMFGSLPSYGLYVRHARGITLRDCAMSFAREDPRAALVCEDVENLAVERLAAAVVAGGGPIIRLRDVNGARVAASVAPTGTGVYLGLEGSTRGVVVQGCNLSQADSPVSAGAGRAGTDVILFEP